jgi:hypothetical protein
MICETLQWVVERVCILSSLHSLFPYILVDYRFTEMGAGSPHLICGEECSPCFLSRGVSETGFPTCCVRPTLPENHLIERLAPTWFRCLRLFMAVERIAEGKSHIKVEFQGNTRYGFCLLRLMHGGDA